MASGDQAKLKEAEASLDFILDTVPVSHDVPGLLQLLAFQGVFCMIGLSAKPFEIAQLDFILRRLTICGILIGGIKDTQEMLNTSDIEIIGATPDTIKSAYERVLKGDVKYRFVLNMQNSFK